MGGLVVIKLGGQMKSDIIGELNIKNKNIILLEGIKGEDQHFIIDWSESDHPYGSSSLQSVKREDKTITFKSFQKP